MSMLWIIFQLLGYIQSESSGHIIKSTPGKIDEPLKTRSKSFINILHKTTDLLWNEWISVNRVKRMSKSDSNSKVSFIEVVVLGKDSFLQHFAIAKRKVNAPTLII